MTALDAVAVHLPPTPVPVEKLANRLQSTDIQAKVFRRFHGLLAAARAGRLLTPGDRYLLATVEPGEGATFAALLFEH